MLFGLVICGAGYQLASARRTKHEMACSSVQNPCSEFVRCS